MGTVTVLGSLNLDQVTAVSALPRRGETVIGSDLRHEPGGKGANQAVAAARAGVPVRMVGACGTDDAGAILLDALDRDDVDTTRVRRTRDAITGVATILVEDSGENTVAVTPGANATLADEDVAAAVDGVGPGDVLLMQLEVPITAVESAAGEASRRGATVLLNAAPDRTGIERLLARVDVLVVNEHEARALAGLRGTVADCCQMLAADHGCLVVVTLGPDGALVSREPPEVVPAPAIEAVDAVGAGDTFTGYLAAGLCRRADTDAAIARAVAAASIAVTRPGAQDSIPHSTELPEAPTCCTAPNCPPPA